MRGTSPGGRFHAMSAFTDLRATTRAVGGGCASYHCLLSESVAVRPFLALVVPVQPIRFRTALALRGAVLRTTSPGGALAVLARAFFLPPALRVPKHGRPHNGHHPLVIAIAMPNALGATR